MKDLSIIIVSFNTKDLLRRCLTECKRAASKLNYEIIVVDNDSKDGSFDMLMQEFPDIQSIQAGANLGFAAANNLGYKQASGQYILLLNSDAFILKNGLELALKKISGDPSIGLLGAKLIGENREWQPSARSFPGLLNDYLILSGLSDKYPQSRFFGRPNMTYKNQNEAFCCDWVPGAFSLIRRAALGELIFDEDFFLYYEEVDLCLRLKRNNWKIWYDPAVEVIHLGGASTRASFSDDIVSKSGKQLTLWNYQSKYLYFRKNYGYWKVYLCKSSEVFWNKLRIWKNPKNKKLEALKMLQEMMQRAWKSTLGGTISPDKPWGI